MYFKVDLKHLLIVNFVFKDCQCIKIHLNQIGLVALCYVDKDMSMVMEHTNHSLKLECQDDGTKNQETMSAPRNPNFRMLTQM